MISLNAILFVCLVIYVRDCTSAIDINVPSCLTSQIYCESDFLHDVQMAGLYPDSKTFVDKKLKYTESEIIAKYQTLKDEYRGRVPPNPQLIKFIDENLEDGDELEVWTPSDFKDNPTIISRIRDPKYKVWVSALNEVWKTLARKVKEDVNTNQDKYSLIYVPNGFIIPGGRFRELYYWDTYWIVNGLLLCDMQETARGVIDNIISMVRRFGFMANGGRVYYLNRSQPPMLILMVLSYYKATKDFSYVKSVIADLEREFEFWMTHRIVDFEKDGISYQMARYHAKSTGPRPESYKEDYEVAKKFLTTNEKEEFYVSIKSGAETGMDFSSRWFIAANGTNRGSLSDINAQNIVPVDLNCLIQKNAQLLSEWFDQMGYTLKADYYRKIAEKFLNNIHKVMWREDKGAWFDWDIKNEKHREYFYVSNVVPLWTESYNMSKTTVAEKVITYLKNVGIIEKNFTTKYKGTPTSMLKTEQQWDFQNAWPPLQAFIIQGLSNTKEATAIIVAKELAKVWLNTNYVGYINNNSSMFEKYDVSSAGTSGAGGEYAPQKGFGWTNGIVLELLNQWDYLNPL